MTMTTNYYTTVEQSKKLLELGLKPETADMIHYGYHNDIDGNFYLNSDTTENDVVSLDKKIYKKIYKLNDNDIENAIPCWSITQLLSMFPNEIPHPVIGHTNLKIFNNAVCYQDVVTFGGDNLFNNLYKMLLWLIEHNYLNKYTTYNYEYYSYTYSCYNKNMLNMIVSFLTTHEKDGVFISHHIEEGTNKDYLFNINNISIKLYVPNNQNLIKEIENDYYLNQWIDTNSVDIENFSTTQIVENNRKTCALINNILMINEDFYNKIFNE